MKQFRVLCTFLLCFMMISQPFALEASAQETTVNNESVMTAEQFALANEIIDELGRIRARKLHESATQTEYVVARANHLDDVAILENELISLGVQILEPEEAMQIDSEILPYMFTPVQSSRVKWYYTKTTHVYKGKVYYINHLYAQALTLSSNLADQDLNVKLKTNTQYVIDAAKKLVSIGVTLGSNYLEELSWLPIDFLLEAGTVVNDMTHNFEYTYTMTACFSYVSEYEDMTDDRLTFSATKVHIVGETTAVGLVDGEIHRKEQPYEKTIAASGYASNERACASYAEITAPNESFVEDMIVKDLHAGKSWGIVNFLQPSTPNEIY